MKKFVFLSFCPNKTLPILAGLFSVAVKYLSLHLHNILSLPVQVSHKVIPLIITFSIYHTVCYMIASCFTHSRSLLPNSWTFSTPILFALISVTSQLMNVYYIFSHLHFQNMVCLTFSCICIYLSIWYHKCD